METINLYELLNKKTNIAYEDYIDVIDVIKEVVNEVLKMASINASFGVCQNDNCCPCDNDNHFIDRDSIMRINDEINSTVPPIKKIEWELHEEKNGTFYYTPKK